jgi:hypothetical protein
VSANSTPPAHGSHGSPRRASPRGSAGTRGAGFAARIRLDWWWIAILVLCGSFQVFRGAPIDGVFFLAAAVALTADAAGWLATVDRYPLPHLHVAAQVVLGTIAVVIIAVVPQFDVVDLVVVSVIAATTLIVGWRDDGARLVVGTGDSGGTGSSGSSDGTGASGSRRPSLTRPVRRSAILWAGAGVFLCLWELASFFLAMPSAAAEFDHPPLSDLVDPIVANPFGRALCAALWLLAGAALLKRGRRS